MVKKLTFSDSLIVEGRIVSPNFILIKKGETTNKISANMISRSEATAERLAIRLANIMSTKKVKMSQPNAK
jgi:hypothetical protein